jgi:hypothetical protein
MVACSVTEECPLAVSAELLWKVFLSGDTSIVTKACVGMIDAVEVEGDGSPGTVTTMKLNPGIIKCQGAFSPRRRQRRRAVDRSYRLTWILLFVYSRG